MLFHLTARFACAAALLPAFCLGANAQTIITTGRGVAATTFTLANTLSIAQTPVLSAVSPDPAELPKSPAFAEKTGAFSHNLPPLGRSTSDTGVSAVPEPGVLVSVVSLGFMIGVSLLRGHGRPSAFRV